MNFQDNHPYKTEHDNVLQLACEPIELVRIAFIGLGKRGKEAFHNFMHIDNVQIIALCDPITESLCEATQILKQHNKSEATLYTNVEDWKTVCEREDIDLVYVCTDRNLHTPIAVFAMEHGKHVALEVPAANTIEECWQLVNTAERTRRHCMMLENCCYGETELAMLNMSQQGLFGEIFHTEGGYIHDLRNLDFEKKKHYLDMWHMTGNPYPTHGLGPLCQLLNIHRGDKLCWINSVSSGQFNFPPMPNQNDRAQCTLGNINTSILRTEKGKTIVLQHDISSPRPYSRNFLLSGTNGFVQKRDVLQIALANESNDLLPAEKTDELMKTYSHPFYQDMGKFAKEVGTHGGMNFIMDYRLIYCLRNGLPLDMDVYDAAEWSSIVELSSMSVQNGSIAIQIPDFTRGNWNQLEGLQFHM